MIRVYEGNTTDQIQFSSDDLDFTDAGWAATLFVLNQSGTSLLPGLPMILNGNMFEVQIGKVDTLALGPGAYILAIKLTNDLMTPAFRRDHYDNMEIMVNVNKSN